MWRKPFLGTGEVRVHVCSYKRAIYINTFTAGSTLLGYKTIRACASAVDSGKGVDVFPKAFNSQIKVDPAGRLTLFPVNFSP